MDNQHKKIVGYRDLGQDDIDKMNRIKATAEEVRRLVEDLALDGTVDTRWVSIARTDLQKGFMALTRAVAQPTTF